MSFISHISPQSQPFLVEISFRKQLSRKFFHSFLVISNQIGAMIYLSHMQTRDLKSLAWWYPAWNIFRMIILISDLLIGLKTSSQSLVAIKTQIHSCEVFKFRCNVDSHRFYQKQAAPGRRQRVKQILKIKLFSYLIVLIKSPLKHFGAFY